MYPRLIILLLGMISPALWAGEVLQVKGAKALLKVADGEFQSGDEVFSVAPDGKKKALLKIGSQKGGKAVGIVVKGTPEVGHTLQLRPKAGEAAANPPPAADAATESAAAPADAAGDAGGGKPPFGFLKRGKSGMGVLLGMAQNKLTLTAQNQVVTETITLSGSSVGLLGYADLNSGKSMNWRGGLGIQTFEAKGSTKTASFCNNTLDCSLSIMYLTTEGWGQYNVFRSKDNTRAWVGLGGEFMIAMSKKNTISALNVADSTNYFFYLSAGGELAIGTNSFVPFQLDYGLQPTSSPGAKAGLMVIRAGYSWRY